MSDIQIKYTLGKNERLYAQKEIEKLFGKGKSFIAYPLRVVYNVQESENSDDKTPPSVSILVSVSKKKFKRAVKRNRVKRLVKEAYRLHKHEFVSSLSTETSINIAFLYLKSELPDYIEIENAMLKTFAILTDKLTTKDES